jgi:hypothetical protein
VEAIKRNAMGKVNKKELVPVVFGDGERIRRRSVDVAVERAIANAEAVCKKWQGKEGMLVQGDMWRKLGHMAVDSVEAGEPHWVRSCGFAEAWEKIPLRDGAKL